MLFFFVNTGFILGILSIHNIVLTKWNEKIAIFFIIAVSYLCGYGMYLGRFLRFNSWVIICTPKPLLTNIIISSIQTEIWCFSISFGLIIGLTYNSLYKQNKYSKGLINLNINL